MSVLFFGSTLLGAAGFCALLLPLGYLVCYASQVGNFRALPRSTQTLWCMCVATPVAVVSTVLLERVLPVGAVCLFILVVAATGWIFLLTRRRSPELPRTEARYVRWGLALAAALGLYVVLAGLPIQVGDHLYESLSTADLSVRVPLVDMAMQHGVPVINPFFSVGGYHPPMRYYYYWYILCGVVGRTLHIPARAALTASGVWTALLLLSAGFLLLSTLFRPRTLPCSTRLLSLLTVPVGMIIGLDILPVAGALLLHPPILYPDSDYWRSVSDFSPSFNLAMLYAPHHVAGIAISFLCFLLILPQSAANTVPESFHETRGYFVMRALLAGICLTMLVGCSTYMGMFACVGGLFVLVERLRNKDWRGAGVILGGAAFGLLLSIPFLREITHNTAHLQAGETRAGAFHFSIHSWGMTKELVMAAYYRAGYMPGRAMEILERIGEWLLLTLCELGFLGVVLAIRIRRDWRDRASLLPRQRYQWMLFFGIALPGFFLSTSSLAGANDLSRHAGVCLRFFGVLWAVPVVAHYLLNRQWRRQVNHTLAGKFALVLVVLGLATQLYQIIGQRFYYMYAERLAVVQEGPYKQPPDFSKYNKDVFYAFAALNNPGVSAGNVLYNPLGKLGGMLNLYQTRYAFAGEPNCMTAFGGDVDACHRAILPVDRLYGGSSAKDFKMIPAQPWDPASMTLAAMSQLCAEHRLAAVLVSSQDRVWKDKESFVWTAKPLYASSRVRLLACPGSGESSG